MVTAGFRYCILCFTVFDLAKYADEEFYTIDQRVKGLRTRFRSVVNIQNDQGEQKCHHLALTQLEFYMFHRNTFCRKASAVSAKDSDLAFRFAF